MSEDECFITVLAFITLKVILVTILVDRGILAMRTYFLFIFQKDGLKPCKELNHLLPTILCYMLN